MEFLILSIVGVILAIFWIWQFVFLMSLEDAIFPGRHDKILWAAAFLLLPFLTPFAFRLWQGVKMNQNQQG